MKSILILYCKHSLMRRYLVIWITVATLPPVEVELVKDKVEKNNLGFDWGLNCPRVPPVLAIKEETVQTERASSHCARGCATIAPSFNEAMKLCDTFAAALSTVNTLSLLFDSFPFTSLPNCLSLHYEMCENQISILRLTNLATLCVHFTQAYWALHSPSSLLLSLGNIYIVLGSPRFLRSQVVIFTFLHLPETCTPMLMPMISVCFIVSKFIYVVEHMMLIPKNYLLKSLGQAIGL